MVGHVVVVGGGQGGFQAAASLRDGGFAGRVSLVTGEDRLPYARPPLSKAYLAGDADDGDVLLRPESFYRSQDIDVVGERAVGVSRRDRTVRLSSGRHLTYDRLVLALGARPRRLPVPGVELDGVLDLRTLADAEMLREKLVAGRHLVVVGAGFIGMEVAATARARGLEVTVVEALARPLSRGVSATMANHLAAEHRRHGTHVLVGVSVAQLLGDTAGQVRAVQLRDGELLAADLVVVGVGACPDTGLAAAAGLDVDDGVLVDGYLRSSDPAIHAIGDCARFPGPRGGRRVRLESVQNAVEAARCAAAGICGRPQPYTPVPWFWTEQYGSKLQIAGLTEGHDRAVVAGDPGGGRFSVFCFAGRRLLGVESLNRPADHIAARRLLDRDPDAAPDLAPDLAPETVAAPGFDLAARLRGRSALRRSA